MFRSIDLNISLPSAIKSAWRELVKHIQQHVEHNRVVSGEAVVDMAIGTIAHSSDDGEVSLATELWSGVLCQPAEPGDEVVMRTDGYARVLFIDGLAIDGGDVAYVSATPGFATNVPGTDRLGIVADASEYDGDPGSPTYNPYAMVCLGYQCAPFPVAPL